MSGHHWHRPDFVSFQSTDVWRHWASNAGPGNPDL